MNYTKDFSVIVPCWRGAINFLPRLFDSIPLSDEIEIIVVDNSKEPVSRAEIQSNRNIVLLHSAHERHAGGSRNDGMDVAQGKWLLFADADDFYTDDAFDVYYSMFDTEAEMVYTGMGGVYADTGEPSNRGYWFEKMVHDFSTGVLSEYGLRLGYSSPCCKMVSHDLVKRHNLRYDEVVASNDMYFSMLTGYYASSIAAIDKVTYIATVNRGSLTRRRDYAVSVSRLKVRLRCNQFVRQHGLSNYQTSIMENVRDVIKCGVYPAFESFALIVKYKQNPFIGWSHWLCSYKKLLQQDRKESKYIVH